MKKLAIFDFDGTLFDSIDDVPRKAYTMGTGTICSAKMIVMDDNFKSIVNGVLEGRVAYSNIRKITYFLISCGLAEVLFFALAKVLTLNVDLSAL